MSSNRKKNKIDLKHLPVGIYADGSVALANLASGNMMCQGIPGSGKSVFLSSLICSLLRCEPQVDLAILSPKMLDFQNFAPAVRLIDDPTEMLEYLNHVRERGNERKKVCMERHIKKIDEDLWDEYPPIVTIMDEFAIIHSSTVMDEKKGREMPIGSTIDATMSKLVAEMRFAAISNVLATQRFSVGDNISSTLRENISGTFVSFKTNSGATDQMLWKDQAENAECHKIRKDQVGCGYINVFDCKPRAFKGSFANAADEIAAAEFYLSHKK